MNNLPRFFQEGMLLVRSEEYGEYVHLVLLSLSLPRKKCNRNKYHLDMAIAVDWDVKEHLH